MSTFARDRHGSSPGPARDRPAYGLALAAALGALALPGCQAETLGPAGPRITEPTDAPFALRLRSDHIDESQCAVRVTAVAEGGRNGAHATWDELEGRSYDFETQELVRRRTQPLYPEVFEAPTIESGNTQWGQVDLEWFRHDADEPVLVELEFHARLHERVERGAGVPQVIRLSLSCR